MKTRKLLSCLLAVSYGYASESAFSVYDDVLAYPQFDVVFSESYIPASDASSKLRRLASDLKPMPSGESVKSELSELRPPKGHHATKGEGDNGGASLEGEEYERMILGGRPYFCTIPRVKGQSRNASQEAASKSEEEKDLARAADRGWGLLQDMEGGPCLFYRSGWWSYSFCYNAQVKQFHQLDPGSGAPIWPPTEDPTTPSYVLGKFGQNAKDGKVKDGSDSKSTHKDVAELQTKAEARYLVQKLSGGTTCDLTGKDRKVEVQFHCHQQSTDRIGWIKEVATCSYLMVINTPRLCNDVAFLPARKSQAHPISCQEILLPEEVADWEARKTAEAGGKLINQASENRIYAGDIEVGGMKEVGRDGRRIEKGKVVQTLEEKAEILALQKDGQVQELSQADLKKLDLNPNTVEKFMKELQELAGAKDWRLELVDDDNGNAQLRGVVATDEDDEGEEDGSTTGSNEEEQGTEEAYREEI